MYFSLIPDNVILLDDGPLDSINEFRGRSVIKEFSSRNVEHIPHPAHYSEETYRNVPELNSRSVYELDSAPVYELDNGNTNYELWDRTSPPQNYTQPGTYQAYHPGLIQTSQGFRTELYGDSNTASGATANHS